MDRHAKGIHLFDQILPEAPAMQKEQLHDIAPDMYGFLIDFAAGEVLSRPGLDVKSREVGTIAALMALGNAPAQLGVHITGGLNAGLTPQEVIDIIYVTTVFAGFPAGLNALNIAKEVFHAHDIPLPQQEQPLEGDRRERGMEAVRATSREAGVAVLDQLRETFPAMADMIVDFSYGDIIARPALSDEHKEIAMIAAAAARGTMAPQLKVHIQAGLNVGLTQGEIVEMLMQMAVYAGFPAALNSLFAAREVFNKA